MTIETIRTVSVESLTFEAGTMTYRSQSIRTIEYWNRTGMILDLPDPTNDFRSMHHQISMCRTVSMHREGMRRRFDHWEGLEQSQHQRQCSIPIWQSSEDSTCCCCYCITPFPSVFELRTTRTDCSGSSYEILNHFPVVRSVLVDRDTTPLYFDEDVD